MLKLENRVRSYLEKSTPETGPIWLPCKLGKVATLLSLLSPSKSEKFLHLTSPPVIVLIKERSLSSPILN